MGEEGETKEAAVVGAQAMGPPNPHMVPQALQTNPAMVPRNQAMEPLAGARALEVWA